ncbi:hypothetical protein Tco_1280969 [Tanacetum coccineum]
MDVSICYRCILDVQWMSRYAIMVKLVPYEAFACRCEAGDVVLRESYKPETRGSSSTPIYSLRSLTPLCYSPEVLTPPSYSLGTSRNAECSNCKHLLD